MDQGKELIRLALFGRPIKSSLSPFIHRMFADQFELNIEYELIETGPEDFADRLEAFRLDGGIGCNITLPLKLDAWRLAADETLQVSLAHAANTLVYHVSQGWFAHNTDGHGLVIDLTVNHHLNLKDQRILVLGAGGAVAGILGSLLADDPHEVVLVNRNQKRANDLAKRFSSMGRVSITDWKGLPNQGQFDLLINATSLGHHGEAPPLEPSAFAPGSVCYDLNYHKASQPLKERCEEIQQSYIDGLGMLVEQAARSFHIWTGKQPDTGVVIGACKQGVD